eukprot:11372665-Prorocentrum_lima.AAC.1
MAQQAVARSAHATVLVQLRPSWALGSSRQVMGDPAYQHRNPLVVLEDLRRRKAKLRNPLPRMLAGFPAGAT